MPDPRVFTESARARAACLAATSGYVSLDVEIDGEHLNLILQGPAGTLHEVAHCTLDTLMAVTEVLETVAASRGRTSEHPAFGGAR